MRQFRPRLLALTAIAAGLSILANGVGAVTAATEPPPTRLGASIQKDLVAQASATAQRNRALDLREATARATEARLKADLDNRTDEDSKGKKSADATEAGEQYDSLARVYQAMKPARAAAVLEQLDMDVQMQVAKRMRDRSTAMILASMSPAGAAALSMALARKSALPRSSAARPVSPVAEAAKKPEAPAGPVASARPSAAAP
jgi:flagellar motility protein MotE (MotC chaperone)